jgi:hypothetical protein
MGNTANEAWPALPLDAWRNTWATLRLWAQIEGKVRLARTPWLDHSWHVALYVNARGLTTSLIPGSGGGFEIQFDFIEHVLDIRTASGAGARLPLVPQFVATRLRNCEGSVRRRAPQLSLEHLCGGCRRGRLESRRPRLSSGRSRCLQGPVAAESFIGFADSTASRRDQGKWAANVSSFVVFAALRLTFLRPFLGCLLLLMLGPGLLWMLRLVLGRALLRLLRLVLG